VVLPPIGVFDLTASPSMSHRSVSPVSLPGGRAPDASLACRHRCTSVAFGLARLSRCLRGRSRRAVSRQGDGLRNVRQTSQYSGRCR
jgi:hypothetical protein